MTNWHDDDDDDQDALYDPDEADQDDSDEEDPAETLPCPRCKKDVYEDADRCPYCGFFITPAAVSSGKTWWFIIAAVLALLAMLMWLL